MNNLQVHHAPALAILAGYCHCGCGGKTPLAKQTAKALGYVKGEPTRFISGHNIRVSRPTKKKKWENNSGTPTYISWTAMMRRTQPTSSKAKWYSDRGITVCERWKDFDAFVEDMGERPEETTLDRIDNDRGYEPDNCRWATKQQQMTNMSTNRFLELNGERLTIVEWSRRTGIGHPTIHCRLKLGWSIERALTVQPKYGRRVAQHE